MEQDYLNMYTNAFMCLLKCDCSWVATYIHAQMNQYIYIQDINPCFGKHIHRNIINIHQGLNLVGLLELFHLCLNVATQLKSCLSGHTAT